jgi:predicted nucleic acid-binding protein
VIAYVDSSVLLRLLLGHADRLVQWSAVQVAVASALVEVECLRTLDRLRMEHPSAAADLVERRAALFEILASFELLEVSRPVLQRAAMPLPTPLGTLDAIHLASATLWAHVRREELVMLTHDRALAAAARATGLKALGV